MRASFVRKRCLRSRRCGRARRTSHGATARALRHARSPHRARRAQNNFARRHRESASTRTISAEGSPSSRHSRTALPRELPSSRHIRTAPQRERLDTHDLRRGFAELKTNSHGATARALRHAQSPQRVRRAQDTFARRHSQSASTRTISADGLPSSRQIRTAPQRERFDTHDFRRGFAERKTIFALRHSESAPQRVRRARDTFAPCHSESRRAQDTFAQRHSESASTRTISAKGSPSSRHIRTAPQRERFDTHNLRRGFAELKTHSHGATARALRHARSPQTVCRAPDTFARRHSESASTRTISAEGSPSARQYSHCAEGSPSSRHIRTVPQRESPSSRHIRTARQRERFDTHNLCKGFAELKTHSHGATARALRHAQSPQRVRRAQDTFARRHSESASTRTISAEGSPSSRQVRTAPQRERFDTHDLRKGFTFVLQRLQMSETLRLPRYSQTLFPKMLRLPRKMRGSLTECCAGHGILWQHTNSKIGAAPQRERSFEERSASCEAVARETTLCDNCHGFRAPIVQAWQPDPTRRYHRVAALPSKNSLWSQKKRLARGFLKKHTLRRSAHLRVTRPCQQKMHFASKNAFGTRLLARTSQLLPLPAKAEKCERHHSETHAKVGTSISCETVASKTTFYAQGQQFEPTSIYTRP